MPQEQGISNAHTAQIRAQPRQLFIAQLQKPAEVGKKGARPGRRRKAIGTPEDPKPRTIAVRCPSKSKPILMASVR